MKSYVAHEQVGYFCKDVIVNVDARLDLMPYAQCGVRFTRDGIEFYSYSSLVARCGSDWIEWGFDALPNYSRTTAKQFGAFCKEYCNWYNYQQWKEDNAGGAVGAWKH